MSTEEGSGESGWTRYIDPPDHDDDDSRYEKQHDSEDVDTDDSMASDASSAPSGQYGLAVNRHHIHSLCREEKRYERISQSGKKQQQQQEDKKKQYDHEQTRKAAKDKSGHKTDNPGKSKRK